VDRTAHRYPQRHIAAEGEFTSHLAINAARAALDHAGIDAQAIDLIVLATSSRTTPFQRLRLRSRTRSASIMAPPSTAAVCSGFIFALATADNSCARGLQAGARDRRRDVSRILDWNDRGTCVLFGDGAGAVVLEAGPPVELPTAAY